MIAVFYHACLHLHREYALNLALEQAKTVKDCGLYQAADQFIVGLNGDEADADVIQYLFPKASIVRHAQTDWIAGEVPTLNYLHDWLYGFPNHFVCYFHMKGLSSPPTDPRHHHWKTWRRTMEYAVLWKWTECVKLLRNGYDSVGTMWYKAPNGSYWAGNFWWATAQFLKTLPEIKPRGHLGGGRYEAEIWIGKGPKLPRKFSFPSKVLANWGIS